MEVDTIHLTKKRIAGSAFFGLMVGLYFQKALNYTIPIIISLIHHSSVADAVDIFNSSIVLKFFEVAAYTFIGAAVGGYLAKKRGVMIGLLTNLAITITLLFILITSVA